MNSSIFNDLIKTIIKPNNIIFFQIVMISYTGALFGVMKTEVIEKDEDEIKISKFIVSWFASGFIGSIIPVMLRDFIFEDNDTLIISLSGFFGYLGEERVVKLINNKNVFSKIFNINMLYKIFNKKFVDELFSSSSKKLSPNKTKNVQNENNLNCNIANDTMRVVNRVNLIKFNFKCQYSFTADDNLYNDCDIVDIGSKGVHIKNGFSKSYINQDVYLRFTNSPIPIKGVVKCKVRTVYLRNLGLQFIHINKEDERRLINWIISIAVSEVNKNKDI